MLTSPHTHLSPILSPPFLPSVLSLPSLLLLCLLPPHPQGLYLVANSTANVRIEGFERFESSPDTRRSIQRRVLSNS